MIEPNQPVNQFQFNLRHKSSLDLPQNIPGNLRRPGDDRLVNRKKVIILFIITKRFIT